MSENEVFDWLRSNSLHYWIPKFKECESQGYSIDRDTLISLTEERLVGEFPDSKPIARAKLLAKVHRLKGFSGVSYSQFQAYQQGLANPYAQAQASSPKFHPDSGGGGASQKFHPDSGGAGASQKFHPDSGGGQRHRRRSSSNSPSVNHSGSPTLSPALSAPNGSRLSAAGASSGAAATSTLANGGRGDESSIASRVSRRTSHAHVAAATSSNGHSANPYYAHVHVNGVDTHAGFRIPAASSPSSILPHFGTSVKKERMENYEHGEAASDESCSSDDSSKSSTIVRSASRDRENYGGGRRSVAGGGGLAAALNASAPPHSLSPHMSAADSIMLIGGGGSPSTGGGSPPLSAHQQRPHHAHHHHHHHGLPSPHAAASSSSSPSLGSSSTSGLEKPYKCKFCSKRFPFEYKLLVHLRKHTGERPFVCPIAKCGKAYVDNGSLKRHLKAHELYQERLLNANRMFACSLCKREFKSRSSLMVHKGHMKHWRPGEILEGCVCQHCGTGCASKEAFRKHRSRCKQRIRNGTVTPAGAKQQPPPVSAPGTPVATEGTAAASGGTPAATEGAPTALGSTPAATDETPAASGGTPAASDGASTASGSAPVATSTVTSMEVDNAPESTSVAMEDAPASQNNVTIESSGAVRNTPATGRTTGALSTSADRNTLLSRSTSVTGSTTAAAGGTPSAGSVPASSPYTSSPTATATPRGIGAAPLLEHGTPSPSANHSLPPLLGTPVAVTSSTSPHAEDRSSTAGHACECPRTRTDISTSFAASSSSSRVLGTDAALASPAAGRDVTFSVDVMTPSSTSLSRAEANTTPTVARAGGAVAVAGPTSSPSASLTGSAPTSTATREFTSYAAAANMESSSASPPSSATTAAAAGPGITPSSSMAVYPVV